MPWGKIFKHVVVAALAGGLVFAAAGQLIGLLGGTCYFFCRPLVAGPFGAIAGALGAGMAWMDERGS